MTFNGRSRDEGGPDDRVTETELRALALRASELAGAINGLGRDTGSAFLDLRKRQYRNQKIMFTMIVVIILNVALAVSMVFAYSDIRATSERVDKAQQSISIVQKRTENKVLCPLYGIFIKAAKAAPPPQYTKQQLADRAESLKVIQDGYNALGCVSTPNVPNHK